MKLGFTPRFQPTDVLYLEKNRNKYSGCWKLAEIPDIQYSNRQWQVMRLPRATVFLYAAYLDTRKVCQLRMFLKYFFYRIVLPVIRIMAFVKGEKIQEKKQLFFYLLSS